MSEKPKEDLTISDKYKLRGAQQMTLAQYEALKAQQSKGSKFQIPVFLKFILGTPFIIIFCCGLVFIPYVLYLIITSPSAPPPQDDPAKQTDSSTK